MTDKEIFNSLRINSFLLPPKTGDIIFLWDKNLYKGECFEFISFSKDSNKIALKRIISGRELIIKNYSYLGWIYATDWMVGTNKGDF